MMGSGEVGEQASREVFQEQKNEELRKFKSNRPFCLQRLGFEDGDGVDAEGKWGGSPSVSPDPKGDWN